jgi:glycine hydroxymethyltransferase
VKCSEYGFTSSHQVFLDITREQEIDRLTGRLEESNIIVDRGIRLGTCEATRRGMKPRDMDRIAELIVRVYKGEEPTRIRRAATKMRREFRSLLYT